MVAVALHWRVFQEPLLFPLETTVNNGYSMFNNFLFKVSYKGCKSKMEKSKKIPQTKNFRHLSIMASQCMFNDFLFKGDYKLCIY